MLLFKETALEPLWKTQRWDKKQKKQFVPMPATVHNYNSYVDGVDLLDSYLAMYHFPMRSRWWYLYLFWHSLMIAMVSAWLLCRRDSRSLGVPKIRILSRRRFQSIIANSLTQMNAAKRCGRPSAAWDATEHAPTPYKRAKAVPCNDVRKDSYGHWPTFGKKNLVVADIVQMV